MGYRERECWFDIVAFLCVFDVERGDFFEIGFWTGMN